MLTLSALVYSYLVSYPVGRDTVVARYHSYLYAGFGAGGDRIGNARPRRVYKGCKPRKFQRTLRKLGLHIKIHCARHGKHAAAHIRKAHLLRLGFCPLLVRQITERKNTFGRAFSGKKTSAPIPNMPHHSRFGREWILVQKSAALQRGDIQTAGRCAFNQSALHRVIGIRLRCQNRYLKKPLLVKRSERHKFAESHPVLSESPRLIHAQNSHSSQSFHGGNAPYQGVSARQPPRSHCEKYCQHHGKFFGNSRHCESYAGKHRIRDTFSAVQSGESD